MTAPTPELCRPVLDPRIIVGAMSEAAARRYLRLMIRADPAQFESFVRLDTLDPIPGTPA